MAIAAAVISIWQSAYTLTRAGLEAVREAVRRLKNTPSPNSGRRKKTVFGGRKAIPCMVVQRFPPELDGRHWLRCKRITGPGLYYDPEGKDIIVYAGVTTWLVNGDEIMAVPIVGRAIGSDPYPTRFYALMNPPTDQATLDEPEADCIVDSPVPCIAEPPDADPCLPLGEP